MTAGSDTFLIHNIVLTIIIIILSGAHTVAKSLILRLRHYIVFFLNYNMVIFVIQIILVKMTLNIA